MRERGCPVQMKSSSSRSLRKVIGPAAGLAVFASMVAIALCLSSPVFAANQTFLRTYPLNSGGCFLLENVNGSVRVEGWERDVVEVRAVKSSLGDPRDLDRVRIAVVSEPGEVAVRTLYPEGQGVEVAVEYVIHVPYRVLLDSIDTVNGSVVVRGVQGRGDLRSVNGNVEVLNSSGRFSARTTNGDLHLELRKLLDGGPVNIQTVNGSVFLGLPSNARADLKVLNMNGDFVSELPVVSTAGTFSSRVFRARLGDGGGGQISVRTINGGIHLVRERPSV